ncbi:MAG: MATE family efflux transporter [Paludibacteraceae bacterium]|nr:MATE family efflux transporter [Paludibacteraceae bacterium]
MDRTKDLETKPIGQLLFTYAMPAVITQVIASVYNIADRIFIGQGVGPLAIAGLAVTFPMMNVIHAFGSLIGAGSSARMSIVLGQKDTHWAEKILGNSTILGIVLGLTVMTFGYLFLDNLLLLFGATENTLQYAREYMLIVLPGMFLTTMTFNLTGLIRASGYPNKAMYIMVGGALLNTLLDPLFIYVFDLGIRGAAWATTISMTCTAFVSTAHFINPSAFIRFKSHAWEIKGYICRNILAIGLSPFLMNLVAAGVVALINLQLIRYGGDMAVGSYGIANTFGSFLFLFIFGVCQGMQPIAGYNYGAGHTDRLITVFKLTVKTTVIIGAVGSLTSCLFPATLSKAFTTDAGLISMTRSALRYYMVMFPIIAFTISNSQFFMSIDKPWISIVTSLSRQILFLAPVCFLLPILLESTGWASGLTGIWMSFPISDIAGGLLAACLLYRQRHIFKD